MNDYSRIGLPADSPEELFELVKRMTVVPTHVPGGVILRWAPGSGEELWIEVDDSKNFLGAAPHFAGESAVRVRLESRVRVPGEASTRAAFWVGGPRSPVDQEFRFVFACPDVQSYEGLRNPGQAVVQLAAFAMELESFPTKEIYYATTHKASIGTLVGMFASRSFAGSLSHPESAVAHFTGHVVRSAMRTNSLTGMSFIWALVENSVGRFDVVADPSQLDSVPPPGSILAGTFWLSGKLTHFERERFAWLRHLFPRGRRA